MINYIFFFLLASFSSRAFSDKKENFQLDEIENIMRNLEHMHTEISLRVGSRLLWELDNKNVDSLLKNLENFIAQPEKIKNITFAMKEYPEHINSQSETIQKLEKWLSLLYRDLPQIYAIFQFPKNSGGDHFIAAVCFVMSCSWDNRLYYIVQEYFRLYELSLIELKDPANEYMLTSLNVARIYLLNDMLKITNGLDLRISSIRKEDSCVFSLFCHKRNK